MASRIATVRALMGLVLLASGAVVGVHPPSSKILLLPLEPDTPHRVVLAVKQLNLDVLEDALMSVSTPGSAHRAAYWSATEIGQLVSNREATRGAQAWARSHGLQVVDQTAFGEYVVVEGSVRRLGQLFSANFQAYRGARGEVQIGYDEMAVPATLEPHVIGVLGAAIQAEASVGPRAGRASVGPYNGTMTPGKLSMFYGVKDERGSDRVTQGVFSQQQTWDPDDLETFRRHFGLKRGVEPENVSPTFNANCSVNNDCQDKHWQWLAMWACGEASLDVQYITAIAQGVPTRVYNKNSNNFSIALEDWIIDVANRTSDIGLVHSISYGLAESQLPNVTMRAFNIEAMKLGLRGVSIFVAAGDGGVCGGHGSTSCRYAPVFPASSPYVTSVGGTMGPESGFTETVSSIAQGGRYTAGGGFSNEFRMPAYQERAVREYLESEIGRAAPTGYNRWGRGYPDLAMASTNFEIVISGCLMHEFGTSTAAPSVAGFFSLINSRRISLGHPPVGFVNPTLYAAEPAGCCNDIVTGSNPCSLQGLNVSVCDQAFGAASGWDPASGLGSPVYPKLLSLFGMHNSSSQPPKLNLKY